MLADKASTGQGRGEKGKVPDPSAFAESELAYLAGMMDADGCINITGGKESNKYGKQYQLRCFVTNTNVDLILWLKEKFNANVLSIKRYSKKHKPGWSAMWYSGNAQAIIKMIRPYMRVKAEQADVALRWPNDKRRDPELRGVLRDEMLYLNKKGPR